MAEPYERLSEQKRFVAQLAEPRFVRVPAAREPQVLVALRRRVNQCRDTELLDESREFSAACGSFAKIDEMDFHPALAKESECAPRILALWCAEYLNFHVSLRFGRRAGLRASATYYHAYADSRKLFDAPLAGSLGTTEERLRPFEPSWLLPGGHLPTIWGKKMRRRTLVHDRVERLATPDGDHLTLARVGTPRPGVPHLLILHGLEGTLGAKYAHGLLALARHSGWSGDLLLFRTCDGEMNSARRLYHSGETTDTNFVVRRLVADTPGIQIVVCGVSLGGNVLVKWLGELGETARALVHRAAAVSVPFDLTAGSRYLERGFSRLYAKHFLRTLRPKALAKLDQFPGAFDRARASSAQTFFEFDDAVTAPLHGFRDAADYYDRSSSLRFIEEVRVPTLLFNSHDDPFVPPIVMAQARSLATMNNIVTVDFTNRGGHVGWIEGTILPRYYYMESRVIEYLSL